MSHIVTYETIKNHHEINAYMRSGDHILSVMGYTEHGHVHSSLVAQWAGQILEAFEFSKRDVELVKIAGYLHDIGNVVNRVNHAQSGALMAFDILTREGKNPYEIAQVIAAIGNHDEGSGLPISPLAAALMIADKSDVRRSRVRNDDMIDFDIHDRVNYAVEKADFRVDAREKTITLSLTIDTEIAPKIEYFEIFLSRMMLCRKAAHYLGATFILLMNQSRML